MRADSGGVFMEIERKMHTQLERSAVFELFFIPFHRHFESDTQPYVSQLLIRCSTHFVSFIHSAAHVKCVIFSLTHSLSLMLKCVCDRCCHDERKFLRSFVFTFISHKSIRTFVCTTKKYPISFIILSLSLTLSHSDA
jgi:hypothetical protein